MSLSLAVELPPRSLKGNDWSASKIITDLGFDTSLELCLDAGDASSAPSTPTKWLDLSGNGYDFFMGTDATAQATDPTHNGTVGGLSSAEYWSFDGGDYFTYDTTNETWMQNIHKDNALFTLAAWAYITDSTTVSLCGSNQNNGAQVGFVWGASSTNGMFNVTNGAGGFSQLAWSGGAAANIVENAWNFIAISADETANYIWRINSAEKAPATAAYTSPSAASATQTLQIGARGNGNVPEPSGDRFAMFMAWSRALSAGELGVIYNVTRRRFAV